MITANVRDLQNNKIVMWQHKNYLLLDRADQLRHSIIVGRTDRQHCLACY